MTSWGGGGAGMMRQRMFSDSELYFDLFCNYPIQIP